MGEAQAERESSQEIGTAAPVPHGRRTCQQRRDEGGVQGIDLGHRGHAPERGGHGQQQGRADGGDAVAGSLIQRVGFGLVEECRLVAGECVFQPIA